MEKNFYTKLTLEQKLPDDFGPAIYSVQETVWDPNLEMMFNMFKGVLVSNGFSEDQINNYIIERADELNMIKYPVSNSEGDYDEYEEE